MNILFATTLYPSEQCPQYVIFLEQQAKALQELGHRVHVLRIVENGDIAGMYHVDRVTKEIEKVKTEW